LRAEAGVADELLHLLKRLDDPKRCEAPAGFDRSKATQRARAFVADLNGRLVEPAVLETGPSIQDASFHSQIKLPGGQLRFSAFGDLVAFTPDHEVTADVVSVVRDLVGLHGYRLMPSEVLEQPYPGAGRGVSGIATWWVRFFDWL
jgi:hypothetical protein